MKANERVLALAVVMLLAACAPPAVAPELPGATTPVVTNEKPSAVLRPSATPGLLAAQAVATGEDATTPGVVKAGIAPCGLAPVVAPTAPAVTYGFAELDPVTGLHVTGRTQVLDPVDYRLLITGTTVSPIELTLDDLRCLPRAEVECALVCPETFVDQASWVGVRLWDVLKLAGAPDDGASIRLVGADGYSAWISPSIAKAPDSLLAYGWRDEALPILHGFPVRGVFPDAPGNHWVKWLVRIEIR